MRVSGCSAAVVKASMSCRKWAQWPSMIGWWQAHGTTSAVARCTRVQKVRRPCSHLHRYAACRVTFFNPASLRVMKHGGGFLVSNAALADLLLFMLGCVLLSNEYVYCCARKFVFLERKYFGKVDVEREKSNLKVGLSRIFFNRSHYCQDLAMHFLNFPTSFLTTFRGFITIMYTFFFWLDFHLFNHNMFKLVEDSWQ